MKSEKIRQRFLPLVDINKAKISRYARNDKIGLIGSYY